MGGHRGGHFFDRALSGLTDAVPVEVLADALPEKRSSPEAIHGVLLDVSPHIDGEALARAFPDGAEIGMRDRSSDMLVVRLPEGMGPESRQALVARLGQFRGVQKAALTTITDGADPSAGGHSRRELLKFAGGTAAAGLVGGTLLGSQLGAGAGQASGGSGPAAGGGGHEDRESGGSSDSDAGSHGAGAGGSGSERSHGGDGSGGSHDRTSTLPTAPAGHLQVRMLSTDGGFHFDPHVVWLEPGGKVTFRVESGRHSTTAYHPSNGVPGRVPKGIRGWDSGNLTPGSSYEVTLDRPGVYDFFCRPHHAEGMVGSIVVGTPDPGRQPGLQPPQESLPAPARKRIETLSGKARSILGVSDQG